MARPNKKMLTDAEIAQTFSGPDGERFPIILNVEDLAKLFRVSPNTIYDWKSKGDFEGTYRQQKKIILFWRNKVVDQFFNGKRRS